MDEKARSELIRSIYDMAIGDPETGPGWSGLVARLGHSVDGVTALLQVADSSLTTARHLGSTQIDPVSGQLYQQHYFAKDLFVTRASPTVLDSAVLSQDILPDEEMLRSEIYNDLFLPRLGGVFYNIGIGGRIDPSRTLLLGVQRDRRRGGFEAAEARLFEDLWQHLLHAMRLRARLGLLEAGHVVTGAALDEMPAAVAVLRAGARLVFANRAARRLLDRRQGLRVAAGGRIVLAQPAEHRRFEAMIGRILEGQNGTAPEQAMRVSRPENAEPLALLATPFRPAWPAHGEPRPAMALLLIADPSAGPAHLARRARALFGLTDAEAMLAEALAGGETLEEIALRRAVRLSTVRSQLQALFAKTGTRRQGELLRLLLNLPRLG